MGRKFIDLTGQKFNMLTVIERAEPKGNNKGKYVWWRCVCECGNECIVSSHALRNQNRLSCGCKEGKKSKTNKFEFIEDYIKVIDENNRYFLISKEDYDFVKRRYCYVQKSGYVRLTVNGKQVFLHSCLIPHEEGLFVDHINRNRNDNRRENLRICTSEQNSANKSITDKNTSGIIGVSFNKKLKKWCSSISKNNKNIYLGVSENKEVAIKIRLQAEKDYYGEFAPQRHLFEEYGIEQ